MGLMHGTGLPNGSMPLPTTPMIATGSHTQYVRSSYLGYKNKEEILREGRNEYVWDGGGGGRWTIEQLQLVDND